EQNARQHLRLRIDAQNCVRAGISNEDISVAVDGEAFRRSDCGVDGRNRSCELRGGRAGSRSCADERNCMVRGEVNGEDAIRSRRSDIEATARAVDGNGRSVENMRDESEV